MDWGSAPLLQQCDVTKEFDKLVDDIKLETSGLEPLPSAFRPYICFGSDMVDIYARQVWGPTLAGRVSLATVMLPWAPRWTVVAH